MVKAMKQGSVIVDMAAEAGGNCAVTQPGKLINSNGVTVIGESFLPYTLFNLELTSFVFFPSK